MNAHPLCRLLLAAALAAGAVSTACQMKESTLKADSLVADPRAFVIHNAKRLSDLQSQTIPQNIIVLEVTFTNVDELAAFIAPSRFQLVDLTSQATYYALSGGDINIPPLPATSLDPGKSIDVTIGFRVPATTAAVRLVYRP